MTFKDIFSAINLFICVFIFFSFICDGKYKFSQMQIHSHDPKNFYYVFNLLSGKLLVIVFLTVFILWIMVHTIIKICGSKKRYIIYV